MLKLLISSAAVIVALAAIMLVYVLTQSDRFEVRRSTNIKVSAEGVFPLISPRTLQPEGDTTHLTPAMDGDVSVAGKIMHHVFTVEKMMGREFEGTCRSQRFG